MSKRIYLSPPHMGGAEIGFVQQAFDSNWISPAGPDLDAFEAALTTKLGISHCAAVSSGTAAIHLALLVLGIKPGDEVLCSSFTFSGSVNPVIYMGATPVFIDSEADTWNMDPVWLERAIQDRLKAGKKLSAIILVHLYGMPARVDEIIRIARNYQIPVVEDAAEAMGSEFRGRPLGTFGDLGILSFNGNKIITTSGGGALVSANGDWIKKARFLATQARDPAPHYQHSSIGYNYRLSNVCAAIGRGQLMALDERVRQKRSLFDHYRHALSDIPSIRFLAEPEGYFSNRWLTTITIDNIDNHDVTPEKIRLSLEEANIESRPVWKPMHLQPIFSGMPCYGGEVSSEAFHSGLCLPSGTALTMNELEMVTERVRSVFKR